jgi:hypothetical protein
VPFPAHCVESGRWTNRGGEAVTHFNKSDQFAVGNDLRYANASGQQGEVWKNVEAQQRKLSDNLGVKVNAKESESSLQLALENPAVQAKVAEFEQALRAAGERRPNVIGVVFVLNGQVYGHEEYGSNALFLKAWPKLLKSQAANAVAAKTATATPPAPGVREVERFLAYGGPAGGSHGEIATVTEGGANDVLPVVGLGPPGTVVNRGGGRPSESRTGSFMFAGSYNTDEGVIAQNAANPQGNTPAGGVQAPRGTVTAYPLGSGRAILNDAEPAPGTATVNTPGNRLNVNRVDGAAGLVTESRDPARQNAVIHKSFIKK